MKIVYAARSPLAGVTALMARVINEYTTHEARVLSNGQGRHTWYIRPGVEIPQYKLGHKPHVDECLEWADVIHCMANVSARTMERRDLLQRQSKRSL